MNTTDFFFFKCILYSTLILVDVIVSFWAVVNVGKFLLFFLAVNPNLDQVVFSLRWIISLKKNKKSDSTMESNNDRYNRFAHGSS